MTCFSIFRFEWCINQVDWIRISTTYPGHSNRSEAHVGSDLADGTMCLASIWMSGISCWNSHSIYMIYTSFEAENWEACHDEVRFCIYFAWKEKIRKNTSNFSRWRPNVYVLEDGNVFRFSTLTISDQS